MLQYFFNKKYFSLIEPRSTPSIEYFCKISKFDNPMSRVLHEHKHMCELMLIYEGTGTYLINERTYQVSKGDLIFCNSSVLHEEIINKTPNMSSYCIGISNLKLTDLPKNHLLPDNISPVIHTGDNFDSLLSLFELINDSISKKQEHVNELANYLTQAIVTKAVGLVTIKEEESMPIENSLALKVKEYIDQYYYEDINLESIAEAVKANRFYLSHVFKNCTGFSPRQYIIRRRIGEAQNLLINTTMNITKVATSVGYNNSNYFQNVFRDLVGYTPGEYRKKWRD